MKTIIFLGAGASKSEGAPLQKELFYEYFNEFSPSTDEYYDLMRDFFAKTYNLNVNCAKEFPSFEEILGLLYIAEKRSESFYFNVDEIKEAIVLSMALILNRKMDTENNYHVKLIENIKQNRMLESIVFITTNYDLLLDRAIVSNGFKTNYYIDQQKGEEYRLPLLKVYGSLNWKYCDVCGSLKILPLESTRSMHIKENIKCGLCGNRFKTIIVPPTFYKEISNCHLNNIYYNVNRLLYDVDNIVFCGYSMPESDLYLKFVIKRAELYKDNPFSVIVINDHENKSKEKRLREEYKYKIFFNGNVQYTSMSFQDFAENPNDILRKMRYL